MKHILLSATAASLIAGSAIAGGYVEPVIEAPVVAPVSPVAVSDWSGFYVGGQIGSGKITEEDSEDVIVPVLYALGSFDDYDDYDAYGLHAGYLFDFGQYVLGAELDYNKLAWDGGGDSNLTRLRARAGYDLGRVLPYLTAGVAHISDDFDSETGVTYGLGVDFKATEQFSIGLEYSRSAFEVDSTRSFDHDMIQLRASYRF